jgi:hypothetical protein
MTKLDKKIYRDACGDAPPYEHQLLGGEGDDDRVLNDGARIRAVLLHLQVAVPP